MSSSALEDNGREVAMFQKPTAREPERITPGCAIAALVLALGMLWALASCAGVV